jgi:hypothetical protein
LDEIRFIIVIFRISVEQNGSPSMNAIPRILTVDPTGAASRLVRAVVELSDQLVIQTDVPSAEEALAELGRVPYQLVVTALRLENGVDGAGLIAHIHSELPELPAILIVEANEAEFALDGNVVVMQRPLDAQAFLRAVLHALDGRDMRHTQETHVGEVHDMGSVPALDLAAVGKIIESLLRDVTPLRMMLATRTGEVLLERGNDQTINREEIAAALLPAIQSTIQMGGIVGGKITVMNFYDGDQYDIFMLAVGYHHFLCLIFEGANGAKQIGVVRSYAQRAAQDIVAMLGGQAYALNSSKPRSSGKARTKPVRATRAAPDVVQEIAPIAVRGESFAATRETSPDTSRVQLEPIADFDPSLLDQLDALNHADADALFDMDSLAEFARSPGREPGLLSDDEARQLGIVQ